MILEITPIFVEHKWGKKNLEKSYPEFKEFLKNKKISEIILVSGKSEHASKIKQLNKNLNEFYIENRERYFNDYYQKKFPIVIKIVTVSKDLRVAVYPNNKIAKKIINYPYGRSELWYIINGNEKQNAIIGNNAKNKKEMFTLIKNQNWEKLFKTREIKNNTTYKIDFGTINGILKNTELLKITNNSDVMFKFPNQNQKIAEKSGKENTFALLKTIKLKNFIWEKEEEIINQPGLKIEKLNTNQFLTFERWVIDGKTKLKFDKSKKNFIIFIGQDGEGFIGQTQIRKWTTLIATTDELSSLFLKGKMVLFIIYPNSKYSL